MGSNGNQADVCMQIFTNLPGCWSLSLCKYLRATHFKFCDEALQVLGPNLISYFFPFYFIICVQVELLTILHKSILKECRALEIKKHRVAGTEGGDICVQGHGDFIIHHSSEI